MTEKTREELIEELELPSYDKWLEGVWDGAYWWDYLVDDFVNDCSEIGMDIEERVSGKYKYHKVYFDLYHNQVSSEGKLRNPKLFYEKYKERLLAESPVMAQMLMEDWFYITWRSTNRGWLEVIIRLGVLEDSGYWDDEVFSEGLMAGTSVAAMYEIESSRRDDFEKCIIQIIEDIHSDFLYGLQKAYEYDCSEERYQEWIDEQLPTMK